AENESVFEFEHTQDFNPVDESVESDDKIIGLNSSSIRLTRQRLDRIPIKAFPDVTSIAFGKVDSADTAMELISRCGQLRALDARHVPLTKQDLDKLHLQPGADVYFQQGGLNPNDICEFARKSKPNMINIFASSFDRDEVN